MLLKRPTLFRLDESESIEKRFVSIFMGHKMMRHGLDIP
jgi:hypothetical protein